MRKIWILLTVVLFFASSYAFAETPASADQERNHSRLPAGTPFVRGGTDQLTILIALADYGTYEADEVRDSLISYGVADVVDYYDARYGTPTVGEMENYDCVICWPNYQYADANSF